MRPDDRIRIQPMIDASVVAQHFISGRSRAAFRSDGMLLLALVRAIEIAGKVRDEV